MRRKPELEGGSRIRPPRGFDPNHRFMEDIKRKDFVASTGLTEAQVCGPQFIREFATCRAMLPLAELTGRAVGLKLYRPNTNAPQSSPNTDRRRPILEKDAGDFQGVFCT